MAILNTQQRIDAEKRVREALGVSMFGAYAREQGTSEPECSEALLRTEREILGAQVYAYGEVWSRPALDLKTRCFITIAALGALTRSEQLAVYVHAALKLGIPPEDELEEMMHQVQESEAEAPALPQPEPLELPSVRMSISLPFVITIAVLMYLLGTVLAQRMPWARFF